MALMFPRLARNFIKNGYFPTDEGTLERVLAALAPSTGPMCILDPCAGEGIAIAETAHALGRDWVRAYAVEYDAERAIHARQLVDRCLHGDLMDTIISRQAFGLLWLNPPYGDLSRDANGNLGYQGQGRARLEKLFYQRTLPLLQYDGVLVFIVPHYVLDAELVGWLTRHFADLRIYRAVDTQFKQVVIFGRRVRQRDQAVDGAKAIRSHLLAIGHGDVEAEELPVTWPFERTPCRYHSLNRSISIGSRSIRRNSKTRCSACKGCGPRSRRIWAPRNKRCGHRHVHCHSGTSPWRSRPARSRAW